MSAPSQLSNPTLRRLVPYSKPWHHAKVGLRIATLPFSFVTGIFYAGIRPIAGLSIIMFLDFAWQLTELSVLLTYRKTKARGIHPVAHLVVDTLLIVLYAFLAVTRLMTAAQDTMEAKLPSLVWFIYGALALVLFVFHAVLFVRDCVEVHQRRVSRVTPGVIWYYEPGNGAPFIYNPDGGPTVLVTPGASWASRSVSSLQKDANF